MVRLQARARGWLQRQRMRRLRVAALTVQVCFISTLLLILFNPLDQVLHLALGLKSDH